MPIGCSCDIDYDPEPGSWDVDWRNTKEDFVVFKPFLHHYRRKRCVSCNDLIDFGSECMVFKRVRHPYTEIEANCVGVDFYSLEEPLIKIPPVYHCEVCAEIWLNLTSPSIGFACLSPAENMKDALKQYQLIYKPKKLYNHTMTTA